MKKIMIITMIGLGSMLAGCGASYEDAPDKDNTWTSHNRCVLTKVVEIEGHRYIIMDGYECGTIIHAASCSCGK